MSNILVALGIIGFVIIDIIICLLINYIPKMSGERAKKRRIKKNRTMTSKCFDCKFSGSLVKCNDCMEKLL